MTNPRLDQPTNKMMQFDHVVAVMPDGRVIDTDERFNLVDEHAPEVVMDYSGPFAQPDIFDEHERDMIDGLKEQGWDVLTGWSADPGHILRSDQLLAGELEERIREEPGFWVALTVEIHPGEDDPEHEDNGGNGESDAAGWIVARKIGSEDTIAARTQWIAEDIAPWDIDPGYTGERPWRDEDVAMSMPVVFHKGTSEAEARLALIAKLCEYAGFHHISRAGESELYTAAALAIANGEWCVRPRNRYMRVRALLMPKDS